VVTALPEGLLADRTQLARAWRERGGRVVGFVSNSVPVELIHAAGCFPLQLPALPGQPTPLADRYMESLFDPMARSLLERLLRGDFACVDLIVLPRAIDSFQRMYYYLCELQRTGVASLPDTYLYDVLQSRSGTSAEYTHARTLELQARLERLTGRAIGDGDLHASIALYNRLRAKLAQLVERRRAEPCQLSGASALDLFSASQLMAPETFLDVLDRQLAMPAEHAPGTRVLLVGSDHDQPALHAIIERAGGQVVGDRHWRGEPLFGPAIDRELPPLRALTQHYHCDARSPRTFPLPDAELVEVARASRAQAAVFYYHAEEEALTWDYVGQRAALGAAGIPSLGLSMQPYPASDAALPELTRFFAAIATTPRRSA
jgi:benzoyl-CoA reductase/2-hydroxyglutaryl-CoA dehydratase subunit BcrC/BadD/HgdB